MIAISVSIQGRHFAAILSSDTGDSTGDTSDSSGAGSAKPTGSTSGSSDSSGAGTGSTSGTTAVLEALVAFAVAAAVLVVLVLQRLSRKQPPSTTFVLRKLLALEQDMRCSRCSRSRYSTSFCALFASLSLSAGRFRVRQPLSVKHSKATRAISAFQKSCLRICRGQRHVQPDRSRSAGVDIVQNVPAAHEELRSVWWNARDLCHRFGLPTRQHLRAPARRPNSVACV